MSSPSSRSAGRRSAAAGNQNQRQLLPNRHNRTAAAARRGADANSRGTQTEAKAEVEVNAPAIAARAPTDSFDIEQALARLEESDAARAAFAAPAPAAPTSRVPDRLQQLIAQREEDTQRRLDEFAAGLDVAPSAAPTSTAAPSERLQRLFAQADEEDAAFEAEIQAQYDRARRKACRQLMECLEGQTAEVHSIAQLYQEFQQQTASSGDESVPLPSFKYEEILAQIETDLTDLQQQGGGGGDYDEIMGRCRERDAVLTKALNEVRAKQEEQEQKKQQKKEEKRQKQIDDLTASMSALQVEMTALRERNATLTDDVGRLRVQNDILSADLVAVRAQVRLLEKQQAEAGGGGSDGDQEEKKEQE